ncbi:hypothetical protein CEXT_78611 [Caerostris extrusa]|uniref:Uncharacterized protein n=1 Tax=Caerostris extrusa TaxID=172846 RepID=A0AAV4M9Z5_CAEEX|nr:hypothetical protein CEXT_78611 [Caerostris extrusa]
MQQCDNGFKSPLLPKHFSSEDFLETYSTFSKSSPKLVVHLYIFLAPRERIHNPSKHLEGRRTRVIGFATLWSLRKREREKKGDTVIQCNIVTTDLNLLFSPNISPAKTSWKHIQLSPNPQLSSSTICIFLSGAPERIHNPSIHLEGRSNIPAES